MSKLLKPLLMKKNPREGGVHKQGYQFALMTGKSSTQWGEAPGRMAGSQPIAGKRDCVLTKPSRQPNMPEALELHPWPGGKKKKKDLKRKKNSGRLGREATPEARKNSSRLAPERGGTLKRKKERPCRLAGKEHKQRSSSTTFKEFYTSRRRSPRTTADGDHQKLIPLRRKNDYRYRRSRR